MGLPESEYPNPLVWSYPNYCRENSIPCPQNFPTHVVTIKCKEVFSGSWEACCEWAEKYVKHG